MNATQLEMTEQEHQTAQEMWVDFQQTHDLSTNTGWAAGIDPESGNIWIGETMADVIDKRDAAGIDSLLWFERVGSATFYKKGGRR